MKYMILVYASQRDYDAMVGKPAPGEPGWTGADFAALGQFWADGRHTDRAVVRGGLDQDRVHRERGVAVRLAGEGRALRAVMAGPPGARSGSRC